MKIAFIAPYEELSHLVKNISLEMDVKIDVFPGQFQNGAALAKELELQKYEVLISRGATYKNIANSVSIPVVNCDFTSFDVLYAVREAIKISRKVGLIINDKLPFNHEFLSETFNIELLYMSEYSDRSKSEQMVARAVESGSEVIVGGVTTVAYAKSLGVEGVLLQTSPETVRQVINNAVEIVRQTHRQILQAERLNQILTFSYEGIIVTDPEGIVTFFNPAAETIMGIKATEIIGNRADDFIPTTRLIDVIKTGESEIGAIQKVRNNTIVTNRIPIIVKDSIEGAVATFQDVGKIQAYEMKIRSEIYKKGLVAKYTFDNYIGESEMVQNLLAKARMYATSDSTVLITGESGTGKEILAQGIHNESERKAYPFVAVNCSSIPEQLLESELFGYDEGAFTGAKKGGKMGMFELAHMGTIFLDEIGSMPMSLQSSLLRVLQEREIWRVGSNQVIQINVRVIAAANNDLLQAVEQGTFRRDLFYRLNVLKLDTIPLRERSGDIEKLLNYFIELLCPRRMTLPPKILTALRNYYWPGNVRELQNFVERISLLSEHMSLDAIYADFIENNQPEKRQVSGRVLTETDGNALQISKGTLRAMEQSILEQMYAAYDGNATLLAQKLEISRTTLWKKLKAMRAEQET
ncbi:sigma 54-interacting transcriptional regulator [Fusibacter paucivorans]|uniref:Sigma 54-interacting transcriptional regulator n=1 Tax=Fusibacter paucivorans TaxID=76009 RepID=A0ABS5PJ80_9FIRM|nr:sigma 54-interacting transcriptional regulator [Fusibacter paucivorans]MBS7525140.1 sigma 54-interacting transcriptional regulator [Fusibacter paucivorans]